MPYKASHNAIIAPLPTTTINISLKSRADARATRPRGRTLEISTPQRKPHARSRCSVGRVYDYVLAGGQQAGASTCTVQTLVQTYVSYSISDIFFSHFQLCVHCVKRLCPVRRSRARTTHRIAKGSVESTHKVPTSHYHTKHRPDGRWRCGRVARWTIRKHVQHTSEDYQGSGPPRQLEKKVS